MFSFDLNLKNVSTWKYVKCSNPLDSKNKLKENWCNWAKNVQWKVAECFKVYAGNEFPK